MMSIVIIYKLLCKIMQYSKKIVKKRFIASLKKYVPGQKKRTSPVRIRKKKIAVARKTAFLPFYGWKAYFHATAKFVGAALHDLRTTSVINILNISICSYINLSSVQIKWSNILTISST